VACEGYGKIANNERAVTMTGSIAANLHEGSRSEYLAQFVFSSFGTAIPVPHQEDTGLDIYCTLLERVGQRAWPRAYYSVQVKSTIDPWVFDGAESVRWFIEHPLPIFLCVVQKTKARILVYHTSPRFAVWTMPTPPQRLEVTLGIETQGITADWPWIGPAEIKAPILDFTIEQLLDLDFHAQVKRVLQFWIDYDVENLVRIKCGIPRFQVPYDYETNATKVTGMAQQGGPFRDENFQLAEGRVKELLAAITTHHYDKKDLVNAAIYAIALRQLSPVYKVGEFSPHNSFLHSELNNRFGGNQRYAYQACDSLLKMVKVELARHGIAPTLPSADEIKEGAIALFAKGWSLTETDARAQWPYVHELVQKHFLDGAREGFS
jgi:hypothetical protein